jgi:hypothetical protein
MNSGGARQLSSTFSRWYPGLVRETERLQQAAQLPRFFPLSYFCPEEITRFTGEPCATELPLTGSWLITLPVATVLLLCWVMVPTMSFAPVMAVVAAS